MSSDAATRRSRLLEARRRASFTVSLIVAVPSSARTAASVSSSRSTKCFATPQYIRMCSLYIRSATLLSGVAAGDGCLEPDEHVTVAGQADGPERRPAPQPAVDIRCGPGHVRISLGARITVRGVNVGFVVGGAGGVGAGDPAQSDEPRAAGVGGLNADRRPLLFGRERG